MKTLPLAALGACIIGLSAVQADAQPVRGRLAVLLDSSSAMLQTPTFVAHPETCEAALFDGCTFSGNPTAGQETCNACVIDTINFMPVCASSWSSSCQSAYQACWAFVTASGSGCSQSLDVVSRVETRGDGTELTRGCDVDGDGVANDSRLYKVKEGMSNVVAGFGEVEYSLMRFAQVEGGQPCTSHGECTDTPGGASILSCESVSGTLRCALDADTHSTAAGQCVPSPWNGSNSLFGCNQCDFSVSFDRALCDAHELDQIRDGAASPISGTVDCSLPSVDHPYMMNHGGCDPAGADLLVPFPATGADSNTAQLLAWMDHQQPDLASDVEISAHGDRPIAAALRDLHTSLEATVAVDSAAGCRPNAAVAVLGDSETCESLANATTAAAMFQSSGIDLYVIGYGLCPSTDPDCTARGELDAIAASGGTTSAVIVSNQAELEAALSAIAAEVELPPELCNEADDDCDDLVDEDFPEKGGDCSAGVGACQASGTLICTADGLGLECQLTGAPGTPSAEICDDIDNDCDGSTDEDFPSKGSACAAGIGACEASGSLVCTADGLGLQCSAVPGAPSPEICDGVDDDCDGVIVGDPCTLPVAACPTSAASGCVAAGPSAKAQLKLSIKPGDTAGLKHKLKWKQTAGPAIDPGDFGDPLTSASFALCVYDDGDLALESNVGPHAQRWKAISNGFLYKDKPGSNDGITLLQLAGGAAGSSKLAAKGLGPNLPVPAPVSATRFLDAATSVVVQLQGPDGCYESVFLPAEISTNDGKAFKAKH